MTKTLILMRHAKSSWDHEGPDHDRPLNARGTAAAAALGMHLRSQNIAIDHVLCSSAKRTQETAALLALNLPIFTPKKSLYLAPPRTLLGELQMASGDTVLLIAHNPGIAEFGRAICAHPPKHPRFADYPTGATLICQFDTSSWQETNWHSAKAQSFITPKDLTSSSF